MSKKVFIHSIFLDIYSHKKDKRCYKLLYLIYRYKYNALTETLCKNVFFFYVKLFREREREMDVQKPLSIVSHLQMYS